MKYHPPFHLQSGTIVDEDKQVVKLWGVNYYAPFNHNYFNIQELGKDHRAAIDEDFRHFKLLDIDFIRMHLYDREISDPTGQVVENHQLEILDYLIDRAEQEDIYLMLTPIVWWNTINNQIQMDRQYAYWHISAQEAFGFSNFFSVDALLWDEKALACQQRYFQSLFEHKNKFSGKRLDEYRNIIAIELCNEMRTPNLTMLTDPAAWNRNRNKGFDNSFSFGEELDRLQVVWKAFKQGKKGTDQELAIDFGHELMLNYGKTMMAIVNRFFGNTVLKAMFGSYSGIITDKDKDMFRSIGVDTPTIGCYLNFDNFDATNTDRFNHLTLASSWYDKIKDISYENFGKVIYEYDATGTLNGYPYAALAAAFAKFGIQMAAYFTYTPSAVAAWNPGWLVHYMNLLHTPRKAAAFAAAGEIFRRVTPDSELIREEDSWYGNDFSIERTDDTVVYRGETMFIYSNSTDLAPERPEAITTVIGHGNGPVAQCSGDGCYFLIRTATNEWRLDLMPDHDFIRDPLRGKVYRGMANRYISCLTEPPVSMLYERAIQFRFLWASVSYCQNSAGQHIQPAPDGTLELMPGIYFLQCRTTC